jgi:hypothetical protein
MVYGQPGYLRQQRLPAGQGCQTKDGVIQLTLTSYWDEQEDEHTARYCC